MFCPSRRLLHPQIPARPYCNTQADSAPLVLHLPSLSSLQDAAGRSSARVGGAGVTLLPRAASAARDAAGSACVTDASVPLERRRWRIQRTRAVAAAAAVDAAGSACVGGGGSISFLE